MVSRVSWQGVQAQQQVDGNPRVSNVAPLIDYQRPLIYNLSGCFTNDGNYSKLVGCNRIGGDTITIYGTISLYGDSQSAWLYQASFFVVYRGVTTIDCGCSRCIYVISERGADLLPWLHFA